jgi:hypothetical protein
MRSVLSRHLRSSKTTVLSTKRNPTASNDVGDEPHVLSCDLATFLSGWVSRRLERKLSAIPSEAQHRQVVISARRLSRKYPRYDDAIHHLFNSAQRRVSICYPRLSIIFPNWEEDRTIEQATEQS